MTIGSRLLGEALLVAHVHVKDGILVDYLGMRLALLLQIFVDELDVVIGRERSGRRKSGREKFDLVEGFVWLFGWRGLTGKRVRLASLLQTSPKRKQSHADGVQVTLLKQVHTLEGLLGGHALLLRKLHKRVDVLHLREVC